MEEMKPSNYEQVMNAKGSEALWKPKPNYRDSDSLVLVETHRVAKNIFKQFEDGFKAAGEDIMSSPMRKGTRSRPASRVGCVRADGKELEGTRRLIGVGGRVALISRRPLADCS